MASRRASDKGREREKARELIVTAVECCCEKKTRVRVCLKNFDQQTCQYFKCLTWILLHLKVSSARPEHEV